MLPEINRTVLCYASRFGTTARCAAALQQLLPQPVTLLDLTAGTGAIPEDGQFILGSGIYNGRIHPAVRKFLQSNPHLLLRKRCSIFLCCLDANPATRQYYLERTGIPVEQWQQIGFFGGSVQPQKLSLFRRWKYRMIFKTAKPLDTVSFPEVQAFASQFTETVKEQSG